VSVSEYNNPAGRLHQFLLELKKITSGREANSTAMGILALAFDVEPDDPALILSRMAEIFNLLEEIQFEVENTPAVPDKFVGFLPYLEGLAGAFNRYRALKFDAETSSDLLGAAVDQPSCFVAGELDPVRAMVPGVDLFANAGSGCTDFRGTTLVNGAGHWVQQEAPEKVNIALDRFLESI